MKTVHICQNVRLHSKPKLNALKYPLYSRSVGICFKTGANMPINKITQIITVELTIGENSVENRESEAVWLFVRSLKGARSFSG